MLCTRATFSVRSGAVLRSRQGPDLVRPDEDGLHHGAGGVRRHHVAIVDLLHSLRDQDLVRDRDLLLQPNPRAVRGGSMIQTAGVKTHCEHSTRRRRPNLKLCQAFALELGLARFLPRLIS